MPSCSSSRLTRITGMPASLACTIAGLMASVSAGETTITSTPRVTKSSMMATWSANEVCVAGDLVSIVTSIPSAPASAAASSKKSVAVLNTPVTSGGVHPMTIPSSVSPPPSPGASPSGSLVPLQAASASARASRGATLRRAVLMVVLLSSASAGCVPAVDDQFGTGHVRHVATQDEGDGSCDLLRAAEPARRPGVGEPALVRLRIRGAVNGSAHQGRHRGPRAHRDRADALRGVVDGDAPGEHDQARLGDVVGDLAGDGDDACLTRDVDDCAAAGAHHHRDGLPREAEGGAQVELEDPVPHLIGGLRRGREGVDAGAVDQGVQPTEALERLVDEVVGGTGLGQVVLDEDDLAAGGHLAWPARGRWRTRCRWSRPSAGRPGARRLRPCEPRFVADLDVPVRTAEKHMRTSDVNGRD